MVDDHDPTTSFGQQGGRNESGAPHTDNGNVVILGHERGVYTDSGGEVMGFCASGFCEALSRSGVLGLSRVLLREVSFGFTKLVVPWFVGDERDHVFAKKTTRDMTQTVTQFDVTQAG